MKTNSLSPHAQRIAKWFDLSADAGSSRIEPPRHEVVSPRAGEIVLVTGPSGAGKSSYLRQMQQNEPSRCWVDAADIAWKEGAVIDQFGPDIEKALGFLGRFGLGEAHTYLQPPARLSDGQQWRLRLACAVQRSMRATSCVLVADEFAAVLDRVTAMVVARALRRAIDASAGLCAVVASSHDDLEAALLPDVVVRCDFSRWSVGEPRRREAVKETRRRD